MKHINPEMAEFIRLITAKHFAFYWENEHRIGCIVNDPLALLQALFPICQGFESYTDLVTEGITVGQTIIDQDNFYKKETNSIIYREVDTFQFWSEFLSVILDCGKEELEKDLEHFKLY